MPGIRGEPYMGAESEASQPRAGASLLGLRCALDAESPTNVPTEGQDTRTAPDVPGGISDAWQFLSGDPWMIGGDYEVLHNSSRGLDSVRLKPLNTRVIQYTLIRLTTCAIISGRPFVTC